MIGERKVLKQVDDKFFQVVLKLWIESKDF